MVGRFFGQSCHTFVLVRVQGRRESTRCARILTFGCSGRYRTIKNTTHLFVCDEFTGCLEDDGAPSLDECICFGDDFHDFCLELLLCLKKTVPQIIANGTFLEEVLECRFVLTEFYDTGNVRHCASDEGSLEKGFVHRRVVLLKQCDIDITLGMRREKWCV